MPIHNATVSSERTTAKPIWHEPADLSSPHPSTAEMTECMQSFGFSQVNLNDWQRVDGTVAKDVKPSDFIKTEDGVMLIDVYLVKPRTQV